MRENSSKFLTIKQVAAWVLPAEIETEELKAPPPPLQRGSVWKPAQVEYIWDSMARMFPIGTFILSKRSNEPGHPQRSFAFGAEQQEFHRDNYAFDLLDGQQRSTAIALGFFNVWSQERRDVDAKTTLIDTPLALWVDIASTALNDLPADGRQFLFRVTTRSHPWGYRRNDQTKTLSESNCREAREQYKLACDDNNLEFKIGQVPLYHTWPWDATAPVPLPLLLQSLSTPTPRESLLAALSRYLPYWNSDVPLKTGLSRDWRSDVTSRLTGTFVDKDWIDSIILSFGQLISDTVNGTTYSIPSIIFDPHPEMHR